MENWYRYTYRPSLLLIILFSVALALSGCSGKSPGGLHSGSGHSKTLKESPRPSFLSSGMMPIVLEEGEFYKAAGWLDDETILYIANTETGSSLYTHHISTGESRLLYKSEHPAITAEISPSKNLILIHSAGADEAILDVINTSGQELFSSSIESHELSFEWNSFAEKTILVSAFTEDWDFKTYILDLDQKGLEQISLPEPFARWVSSDQLVFQDWDEDGMSLEAPLMSYSLKEKKIKQVFRSIFQFDAIGKNVLTINMLEENPNQANYVLYNKGFNQLGKFDAPLLTSFSGWLVPFYDLMNDGEDFIYFRALHKGEADVYDEGFDLVRFNLDSDEEKVILSNLNNEPLSCAPSAPLCLYGFQFEKLLDIESKQIVELTE
ncbi:hypothetical protein [Bacillus sp. REN3]|uniref:YqgU-like beta propeller domain-containing protein n=1 Tax=Bacillus sp. REN3 TaxID=2802440 RepID=UPI001AEF2416|nr:hypothetical protein [Bacillus sp. REN3]